VGESSSNGGIEGAVKILKGLLRVHLAALERRIGARFPSNHPVLTWLVEHVADVISKYMVGVDGKTAYERLYGRPVREEALEFGETLHWRHRPSKDMNVVLDARWSTGVWLGRAWGGVVHQVYANGAVHTMRGVQRQPRDLRWRKEALEAVSVTPWAREPPAEGELRVLPPLAPPALAQGAAADADVRSRSTTRTVCSSASQISSGTASQLAAAGASSCARAAARKALSTEMSAACASSRR
jgi:hypothetical protein